MFNTQKLKNLVNSNRLIFRLDFMSWDDLKNNSWFDDEEDLTFKECCLIALTYDYPAIFDYHFKNLIDSLKSKALSRHLAKFWTIEIEAIPQDVDDEEALAISEQFNNLSLIVDSNF